MLTAEVAGAERHVLFTPRARTVAERLGARTTEPWSGPGDIVVNGDRVRFKGERTRHTSRSTIEAVVRAGALVWIRRRAAHDWLVRCRRHVDARMLEDALTGRRW